MTVTASSRMVIRVSEPQVSLEVQAPPFAGNEPFPITLKVTNDGEITAQFHMDTLRSPNGASAGPNQDLVLEPGQSRFFRITPTIGEDTLFTATLQGDVSITQTVTVTYGYKQDLTLAPQSIYPEGPITIPFTLTNSGQLPFSGVLWAELFTVGGSAPLHTLQRPYTVYPGQEPHQETLSYVLAPGNYRLRYYTADNDNPVQNSGP
ncbi:MAG: hypothetical protein GY841_20290, partial [FCB group bacterium]|nr:hypothetical protein [FCB group bacterium]